MEAAAIEAAEARAWADMYAAAPPEFARAAGVRTREVGGALVLSWAATGRRYFSRAIGLGVAAPVTPEALDRILEVWEEEGTRIPAAVAARLRARWLRGLAARARAAAVRRPGAGRARRRAARAAPGARARARGRARDQRDR